MQKTYARDTEAAAAVAQTARITGVSKRLVNYVINRERENRRVFDCYMDIREFGCGAKRIPYLKRKYGPEAKGNFPRRTNVAKTSKPAKTKTDRP